jgi:hypothetical protein
MSLRRLAYAIVAASSLAGCDSNAGLPSEPIPPPVRVVITVSRPELQVHESALYVARVLGVGPGGDTSVVWASSDPAVATVQSGVVIGRRRGTVVLTASVGRARDSVTVRVWARLRIRVAATAEVAERWVLSSADSVQLEPVYVDVDGAPIDEQPSVSWESSNTDAASVGPSGEVIAALYGDAVITARGDGGPASIAVHVVWSGLDGIPVRFAHAADGVGQVVLALSYGDTVRLSFGDTVVRTVPPGSFAVDAGSVPGSVVTGFPSHVTLTLQVGDHPTIYVVGGSTSALLATTWGAAALVPADSGRIRLVQGGGQFPVILIRPAGAPLEGVAEQCYFDPGGVTEYYTLPVAAYELLLPVVDGTKLYTSSSPVVRIPVTVPAGRSVTYVLTGDTPETMRVLAFPDP